MTPVERYSYLKDFWKKQVLEAEQNLEQASKNYKEWSDKLVAAEIAEQLANQK